MGCLRRRCSAGLATGDPDAAAAFLQRFQRRVFGLAVTIVGDPRAAEDISQEAFVRAWKHAGAYDCRRGTVSTWLLTITRNLAIDAVRVRRPVVIDPDSILAMNLSDGGRLPDELAALRDDADRLSAAMARSRRAATGVGDGGIARAHRPRGERGRGHPLGTAKTRIRTALLARLRSALTEGARRMTRHR